MNDLNDLKELDFRIDPGKFGFWYDLDKLVPFQGDLVEMKEKKADKLERSLKRYFIKPFMVWCAPDNNVYILDGHQRRKKMIDKGFIGQVPCVGVKCDNEKEAKDMILKFRSQHGEILDDSKLNEFIETNFLDWEDVKAECDFPELNMGTFEMSYYEEPEIKEKEVDELGTDNECPKCHYKW